MPFRTLSSIEFQGSCSRDLNLGQSENCIFEIYDQYSFCTCLSRTSQDLSGEVKSMYFQLTNRKNVKVNIMRFRILCSIEFQGPLLQKLEFITVLKFYFWNLWSMVFLSLPHSCITRQCLDLKTSFSSSVIENVVKVNIMLFRTLCSIEIQGSCSKNLNLYAVLKLYFWHLRSTIFLSMPYSYIYRLVRVCKKQVFPDV
jgi:hypothetical protein